MKREENLKLFQDREKNWITYGDLVRAMKEVKADDCDALLIHTDLSFGLPTRELKRKELVEVLYDAICELGVKTLIFPTFTFSYGNREDFDVKNTKCKMGMLNEYVRKMPGSVRSRDPLMSVLLEKTKNLRKLVEINHLVREVFLTAFITRKIQELCSLGHSFHSVIHRCTM